MENKLIVILGQTASGKSDLAVKIAKRIKAEIISADSRQVYKNMDIGSGKITKEEMQNIPHYLLDVASPKKRFTVSRYQIMAKEAIDKILKKNKIPIICGGSGFYIQTVIDGITIPEVKPDYSLRKKFERMTTQELFSKLKQLDRKRAENIDKKNRRRLIRSLEILIKTKKPIPSLKNNPLPYPVLIIGIKKEKEELRKLIKKRLLKRLKQGMVQEAINLHKSGISWQRLEEFGLEYRLIARYLQKKITYKEMLEQLQKETEQFAKRQMTWFKKDKRLNWIRNYAEAEKLVKEFI